MMTSGQQRALRELRRLQAADSDGFTIVTEPQMIHDQLVAMVSIRLGPIETAAGGLELREREDFIVCVSPNFPFEYPRLSVDHTRFAGFPHVVWVKTICLYRSAVDWNPRDGLYGFFDTLRAWLWKAAINDMDPGDAPLEPPHHVTAFSQVPFVIRANAPVTTGEWWLGLAQLQHHPNRTDLVGWSDGFEGWPPDRDAALAVILQEPFPMEFPRKGKDFFDSLEKQTVDRDQIIRFLALAAALREPSRPIHLVLGLPMRRARDGSPRLHVAVWTTSAAFAKGLRLTVAKQEDSQSLREIRKDLADDIRTMLEDDEIVWCQILEDRPEIVTRRDRGSAASWLEGKRLLLLGCGALGSWIGEIAARAGAASIDLVDNAIVKPGLLARQNYALDDIGKKKSAALASRLQTIREGIQCASFSRDGHAFIVEDAARFAGYDLVIDCTASSVLQMKLERDWAQFKRSTPRMMSLGIDSKAQRCLSVTVPANSVGGVWDAFVQLKHRLCLANTSREVIDAFYSDNAGRDLLQPEPGCSDPTFCGSTADVAALAAGMLNMALPQLTAGDVPCGIAFTSHPPRTSRTPGDVFQLMNFEEFTVGEYRVRVAKNVHHEVRGWVRQHNRVRSKEQETGGLLWGLWDDAVGIIWVIDASGPPADSMHDAGHFVCGVVGTREEHERRFALTRGVCGFVGMWHTHPDMTPRQSVVDIGGMTSLVAGAGQNQRRALMVIYGRTAGQPKAGFYMYESQLREKADELITVGMAERTLETSVV